jgi:hypothetical protein
MAKKIDWLDNFAESMAKQTKLSKVASKITREDIIVDREEVKNARIGETINFNGKLYKVADLDFEDEKGPGAVLTEVDEATEAPSATPAPGSIDTTDPMSVSMGAPAAGYESGQKPQEYARTNPGDVYHYEVPETFEQAAVETAQQIETERNFDRSSVPGHYTAPKNMGGAAPVMDTTVTEVPVDAPVAPVEETPVEDVIETPAETPAETEEVVEETTTEEAPTETEEVTEEVTEEPEATEEEEEKEEEDKEPVVGARYNRILRRIMASK